MNKEEYKYDSLKELGIDERELLQFVRETLEELQIPYTNVPGKFVIGESMFEGANVMPHEDISLRIKTVVRDVPFMKEYSFVSIADTTVYSWDMNNPVSDYSNTEIPAA